MQKNIKAEYTVRVPFQKLLADRISEYAQSYWHMKQKQASNP